MKTMYTTASETGTYEHSEGVHAKAVHTSQEAELRKKGWVYKPDQLVVEAPKNGAESGSKPDYKALAESFGIPLEVDGKKVHHSTLKKQVEEALNASDKGPAT